MSRERARKTRRLNPTLVTVPPDAPFDAAVILPYASTVTLGLTYVPAVTPDDTKSIVMLPEETIGEPETVNLDVDAGINPTLVTVPPPPLPLFVELMVMFPVVPVKTIPGPALSCVTPVFVMETTPVVVLAVMPMPFPEVKLLKGLEHANRFVKFC